MPAAELFEVKGLIFTVPLTLGMSALSFFFCGTLLYLVTLSLPNAQVCRNFQTYMMIKLQNLKNKNSTEDMAMFLCPQFGRLISPIEVFMALVCSRTVLWYNALQHVKCEEQVAREPLCAYLY